MTPSLDLIPVVVQARRKRRSGYMNEHHFTVGEPAAMFGERALLAVRFGAFREASSAWAVGPSTPSGSNACRRTVGAARSQLLEDFGLPVRCSRSLSRDDIRRSADQVDLIDLIDLIVVADDDLEARVQAGDPE